MLLITAPSPTVVSAIAGGVLVATLLLGCILLLLACILVFPKLLAPALSADSLRALASEKERLTLKGDRLKLQNDVRTSLLQGIGGAALLAGLFFTWVQFTDQQDLARRGQIADRFTHATDQLASDKLAVRLGGIYGLENIARDSGDDHTRVAAYELLAAYVREHAPWDEHSPPYIDLKADLSRRAPDVQAALTALVRRDVSRDDPALYLGGGIDLRIGTMESGHLEGAILSEAHLEGATLDFANLEKANLKNAHFESASLLRTKLADAYLAGAHLQGAGLYEANLKHASLPNSDLKGASLVGADLETADLDAANLEGAQLHRAKLKGALLRRTNLKGATADKETSWPDGFNWRTAGVVMR